MSKAVGKKINTLSIILIASISILIGFGIRNDISVLFNYYTKYNEDLNIECQNFSEGYKSISSYKQKDNDSNPYPFFTTNKLLFDAAEVDKINFKELTELEIKKFCIKINSNLLMSVSDNDDISAFGKSIGVLNYHKLKICINIAAALLGILVLYFIAFRIKAISEGWFRLSILFGSAVAIIPFFMASYNELATPQTQAITFPASIFLTLYILYKIYQWIANGFEKSNAK